VQYVQRSREPLVLDALEDSDFAADPYIQERKPKSILCAPLTYGDQIKGIVYLENDVTSGAFTADRLASLNVIAAQAAVAVENARMNASLEETVAERTRELHRAHAQLMQLERTSTETRMAGGFAHEMRNALAGPAYVLDAALGGKMPVGEVAPLMREILETAHEGLTKGLHMVERILWYAQMERLPNANENVVLRDVVDKVLKDLAPRLDGNTIQCDIGVPQGTVLAVQPDHVETILSALMANAADAVTAVEGARKRCITLSTEVLPKENCVNVVVKDNGVGMTGSTQERVFQPFFSTKGVGAAGLSLGVSQKLATMYGGALTFTSEENKGSEFTVRLPLKNAPQA